MRYEIRFPSSFQAKQALQALAGLAVLVSGPTMTKPVNGLGWLLVIELPLYSEDVRHPSPDVLNRLTTVVHQFDGSLATYGK